MTEPETVKKRNILRRLYDWVLSWAASPYGTWALFVISFAESSFFPIPPDPLLIALCLGRRTRSFWYATVCTLGSVLGGIFGYILGRTVWDGLQDFMYEWIPGFHPETVQWFSAEYHDKGFLIVFLAGFSPIPYKVFTIVSGALQMSFLAFVTASAISRAARFFLLGLLIWRYGTPIYRFIDKNFDRLAWVFVVLIVGGFFVVKWIV